MERIYDRNEFKLIERIEEMRKLHPNIIVYRINRPYDEGYDEDVFSADYDLA